MGQCQYTLVHEYLYVLHTYVYKYVNMRVSGLTLYVTDIHVHEYCCLLCSIQAFELARMHTEFQVNILLYVCVHVTIDVHCVTGHRVMCTSPMPLGS